MGQIEEGQLYKYTNVMKGWQPRWFVLNPDTGILDYYMQAEDTKRSRPRGSIHLENAVISPSEEDSNTFNVNSASGEVYRLRASDARERQLWVNRLRTVAERHGQFHSQNVSPRLSTLRDSRQNSSNIASSAIPTSENKGTVVHNTQQSTTRAQQRVMCNTRSLYDTFSAAQEILIQAEMNHHLLASAVEELPTAGNDLRCTDPNLLLLKATSQATLLCLKQCLGMLQHQQQAASFQTTGVTGGATMELLDPYSYSLNWSNSASNPDISTVVTPNVNINDNITLPENTGKVEVNSEDEVTDEEESYESEMRGSFDDKKIFQLISQLKLGTDLTKVKSPPLILEPYSMLEMYANFFSHPDIFLRIPEGKNAEQRMLAVVEWYITSFHVGRKGSSIKKPYNPVLGELFFCSWDVPDSRNVEGIGENGQKLKFTAEQVSHHPLVSSFYVENSEKTICMNATVGMKSRFLGMSIAINVIGEGVISILPHEEDYIITYPNACARIIVSSPSSELTGKVVVSCNKTGYSASITFHSKPFYGGKFHRITAEVKNAQGDIICKIQGEWNGSLEFVYANGDTKIIDTSSLKVYSKRVRPCAKQSEMESRNVWRELTAALKDGNMKLAAEHKQLVEDCQRIKMKKWKDSEFCFVPRYFQDAGNGENWEYVDQLKHRTTSA